MPRDLPSISTDTAIHDSCRAAAREAVAVLGDVWIAPHLDRGGGGMLRRDSGDSTEFHDHRLYAPGDDPRRINWAAYARTGQLTLKLFRQEGRPLIDCLFDVSASMWNPSEKAERVLELLYFIIESASAQQAGLRIWALAGAQIVPLPVALINEGTRWIEELPETKASPDEQPISTVHVPLRPGSQRILLSDLLYPVEPDDLVRPLTMRNGAATILTPWHREEADPIWGGVCQLDDAESQTMREIEFDRVTAKNYLDAYHRHFETWRHCARRHATSFSRIPCGGSLAAALGAELTALNPSSTQ